MIEKARTLGSAIDMLLEALEPLDAAARETAIVAVSRQLKIALGGPGTAPQSEQSSVNGDAQVPPVIASPAPVRVDIRSLKDQKKPNSAKQMACVVAYYLKELADTDERRDTVTTADIEKYFKQAGFRLQARMAQVLVDAKNAGYFDPANRGEYKLNAVGYNLVAHNLPSEN